MVIGAGMDSLPLRLLEEVSTTLQAEPALLDLSAAEEVCVVGDLHGSLECLQLAIRACGASDGIAPGHVVLFNGDFIDRGDHSTEVVASLLAEVERAWTDYKASKTTHLAATALTNLCVRHASVWASQLEGQHPVLHRLEHVRYRFFAD